MTSPLATLPLAQLFELSTHGVVFRSCIAPEQQWVDAFAMKIKEQREFLDRVCAHSSTLVLQPPITNVKQERSEEQKSNPDEPSFDDEDQEEKSNTGEDQDQAADPMEEDVIRPVRDRSYHATIARVNMVQYAQQQLRQGRGGFVLDFKEFSPLRIVEDDVTKGGSVLVGVEFSRHATQESVFETAYLALCDALGEEPTKTRYSYGRWDKSTTDINKVGSTLFRGDGGSTSLQNVLYHRAGRLRAQERAFSWWCYNVDDGTMEQETAAHIEKAAEQEDGFSGERLVFMLIRGGVKY